MDEVPDDEEVVRESHLADRLELEPQPLGQLGRRRSVPAGEALLAQLDEVVERVPALGNRIGRQEDATELELDRASLRDLERPCQGVLEARKSWAISSGVLKKNSFVSKRQWSGFLSVSPDWMQRSASCAYASPESR